MGYHFQEKNRNFDVETVHLLPHNSEPSISICCLAWMFGAATKNRLLVGKGWTVPLLYLIDKVYGKIEFVEGLAALQVLKLLYIVYSQVQVLQLLHAV